MIDMLHKDAVRVLTRWTATAADADQARERTLELLTAGPATMTRAHRTGHLTASTLIVDAHRRFLLCLHGRLGTWMQLGGHCEPGDLTLAGAALREASEESGILGLDLDPEPIDVDVQQVMCCPVDGAPAEPSVHYDIRFLARCPNGATERISAESLDLAWFTAATLPSPLASGTARQIAPAFARMR